MRNQYNKLYNQNKNNENNNNENNNIHPLNIENDNQNQNIINAENNNNQINDGNQNQNKINEEKSEENKNSENNDIQENNNGEAPPYNENSDCPVPAIIKDYEKNFSFGGLMSKIKETQKKNRFKSYLYGFITLLWLESPTISVMDKAIIYRALGYFITPIDIVPLIGLTDDIAVLGWAFSKVRHNVADKTREKAKTKLKIWFGEFDEK